MATRRLKRGRRGKPDRTPLPDREAAQYSRELRAYVREMHRAALPGILERYETAYAADERRDADPVDEVLRGVSLIYQERRSDAEVGALIERAGDRIKDRNAAIHRYRFRVVSVSPIDVDPWLGPVMDAWGAANADLVTQLPDRLLRDIERGVQESWRAGETTRQLADRLQERVGVTERRARLIARDQTNKLNGQLHGVRQTAAGVTEYRWATSMDSRVRQAHADRHGDTFKWSSPPSDGHPGQAIQCRCTPDPVLDDLMGFDDLIPEDDPAMGFMKRVPATAYEGIAERTRASLELATTGLAGQEPEPSLLQRLLDALPSIAEILAAYVLAGMLTDEGTPVSADESRSV